MTPATPYCPIAYDVAGREIDPQSWQAQNLLVSVPLDERAGYTAYTRNGKLNGTGIGTPPPASSLYNQRRCASFANNQAVTIPLTTNNLNEFTFSYWCYGINHSSIAFILSNRLADTNNGVFSLMESGYGFEVGFINAGSLTRKKWGNTTNATTLYHIAGVHPKNANSMLMYLNGVAGGTQAETAATVPGQGGNWTIGRDGGASASPYWLTSGKVWGVNLYDRALSSSEILQMYQTNESVFTFEDDYMDVGGFKPWFTDYNPLTCY